jgi:DNA primase
VGFAKTAVLFNLHRAGELAREKGEMVVVEGYFTVFKLFQCGIENAVALMGSYLSEQQKQLLVETLGADGKVILLLYNDEAGTNGAAQCVQELVDQLYIKQVRLPEGVVQPDELSDHELSDLLAIDI